MRTTLDYMLWAVAFVFLIVGIDQSVKGFQSYWAFMISLIALFLLNWFKVSQNSSPGQNTKQNNTIIQENFLSTQKKTKKEKKQNHTPAKKRR